MNSQRFIVVVWMLFSLGCSSDATSVNSSDESLITPTRNCTSNLSLKNHLGGEGQMEAMAANATANATANVTASLLEQWRAPLKGDEVFFNPPTSDQPEPEPASSEREISVNKESIRLLGFVQVGEGDPSTVQAILRIDDRLAYLRAGDSIEDLEVVNVSPPRVTLQSHRQRWDIGLFDQPAIKKDFHKRDVQFTSVRSVVPNLNQTPVSPRRSNRRTPIAPSDQYSPSAYPAQESAGVKAPSPEPAGNIEQPIIPELPEAPEFPELGDLP